MNVHADIVYGETGQSLVWDAPEGRPSSVTGVQVFAMRTGDDGTEESATTGSASVETNPNTTVDAASGSGQSNPRVVNVAATTGFVVGRDYLITAASSVKEWFTVASIDDGNSVTAMAPLANAYASADTVESTRITISVDSTWVADQSNISDDTDPNPGYRIRWEYVVDSVTYVHQAYFDLVRYPGGHTVTPADMESFYPNWADRLPSYHQINRGSDLIDEAYQQVKWDMHASGHADEMVRSIEGVNELVKCYAVMLLERSEVMAGARSPEAYQIARDEYMSRLDQLIRVTTTLAEATGTSGAGHDTHAVSLLRK